MSKEKSLEEKYKDLLAEREELYSTIAKLETRISKMNAEMCNLEAKCKEGQAFLKRQIHKMFKHMGWFRTILWKVLRKDEEE